MEYGDGSISPFHLGRAEELLGKLSLRRKVGQMVQAERLHITPQQVAEFGIGSVLSGGGSIPGRNRPEDWVALNDAFWEASMSPESGGPGIPLIYGVDAIHGHNNAAGAVIFPHNIGLGATHDPDLVQQVARVTAREVLATGLDWTFAPTLAVAGDPRWGRTYESFSDDTTHVNVLGGHSVRGLQGAPEGPNSTLNEDGIVACAKHWVGDGGTTDGVDQGDTRLGEDELRRVHVAAYRDALQAGVLTVMVSFNRWNGELCHAHRWLVTDLLKGEIGFQGFVVSDWNAIRAISSDFGVCVTTSVNAGIDMFMVPAVWNQFLQETLAQVESGAIAEARVDDACRRILAVKSASGLLDRVRPAERKWTSTPVLGTRAHRAVAREAVRKSLVLLKHQCAVLPLHPAARILVCGDNANDRGALCGGFTIEWQGVQDNARIKGGTSVWEGIRAKAPAARLITGEKPLTEVAPGEFDVAVAVVGETPYVEGLGDIRDWTAEPVADPDPNIPAGPGGLEAYGDSLTLSRLHPEAIRTLKAVRALGLPVVVVLVSGRPLVVEEELALADAFVAAWLPGSEGGGIADVLFGEVDFSGRLAMPWPSADPVGPTEPRAAFPRGYGLTMGITRE